MKYTGVSIYDRLTKLGWTWTNGNSRLDFYRKGNWLCIVPFSIDSRVRFERINTLLAPENNTEMIQEDNSND